ncbi:MHO_1590 family protein [Mycoplasma phocimorsus]|uniref:MHO_1590 family protein n=1 Tax=Mycoplasma phocimorsus TaxID=3045839 RepID=UPI0024BF4E50|nr:hypothetical protein [Mycoplasma phocimorsus]MDJ1646119.1 hypothetical protein [Mycoplasma phocimorsus]MDJ1647153.1 hypothetical protein [Mycoplasma phocimorsus]MDJ1648229.1 hypothetical protein [Mycoplasma phocimorsus]MDJ1648824.1 hypothetical protein [Mycoplasma phocimorsus]
MIKNKCLKILFSSLLFSFPFIAVSCVISKEKNIETNIELEQRVYTHENLFPRIELSDYYNEIRYDSINETPYFDKDFSSNFIKDLITRLNVSDAKVRWQVENISARKINIYISLLINEKTFNKTYTFEC